MIKAFLAENRKGRESGKCLKRRIPSRRQAGGNQNMERVMGIEPT